MAIGTPTLMGSASASGGSITITAGGVSVGDYILVMVACGNAELRSGRNYPSGSLLAVSDENDVGGSPHLSNPYVCLGEYVQTSGVANDGVLCSLWAATATFALSAINSDFIFVTLPPGVTSGVAKVYTGTLTSGKKLVRETGIQGAGVNAANPGSLTIASVDQRDGSVQRLLFRVCAALTSSVTPSATSTYTLISASNDGTRSVYGEFLLVAAAAAAARTSNPTNSGSAAIQASVFADLVEQSNLRNFAGDYPPVPKVKSFAINRAAAY